MNNNTCPECRAVCREYPQRDYALREILLMIYSGLGQEMPAFDPAIFVQIYVMLNECRGRDLSKEERKTYWAPMIEELRRMRGVPTGGPPDGSGDGADDPIDVDSDPDVDMESDWELGSGAGSEEGESRSASSD